MEGLLRYGCHLTSPIWGWHPSAVLPVSVTLPVATPLGWLGGESKAENIPFLDDLSPDYGFPAFPRTFPFVVITPGNLGLPLLVLYATPRRWVNPRMPP